MLIAAALLAGVAGLALVAVGWWVQDWQYISDWTDPTRWWGALARGAGILLFSKLGLKLAIMVILAVVGVVTWIRARRSTTAPDSGALTSAAEVTDPHPAHADASR